MDIFLLLIYMIVIFIIPRNFEKQGNTMKKSLPIIALAGTLAAACAIVIANMGEVAPLSPTATSSSYTASISSSNGLEDIGGSYYRFQLHGGENYGGLSCVSGTLSTDLDAEHASYGFQWTTTTYGQYFELYLTEVTRNGYTLRGFPDVTSIVVKYATTDADDLLDPTSLFGSYDWESYDHSDSVDANGDYTITLVRGSEGVISNSFTISHKNDEKTTTYYFRSITINYDC